MKRHWMMALLLMSSNLQAASMEEDLRTSDQLAATESARHQSLYWEGVQLWQQGNDSAALNALDYAAWQGSIAAATRLCVMDAYGIGTEPNALKATYWCDRAAAAGHNRLSVRQYLNRQYLAGD